MEHTNLIDHILDENFIAANKVISEKLAAIQEQKLYEIKRSIQLAEVVTPVKGKPGQFKGVNTAKDWAKYRKEHPSLGMYDVPGKKGIKKGKPPKHEKTASGGLTAQGIEARRKKGYLQAHPALKSLEFIKKVTQYHKTGKIDEETPFERQLKAAAKEAGEAAKARRKAPPVEEPTTGKKKPTMTKVAKGFKALAPKGYVRPKTMPTADRYERDLSQAKELESRGSTGKVDAVQKAYRTHRIKTAVGGAIKRGLSAALQAAQPE